MSHSKFRKNGKSLYADIWNPACKKYINTCCLCGRTGYSPALDEQDFQHNMNRRVIHSELTKMFPAPLELDSFCRCAECAKLQDNTER